MTIGYDHFRDATLVLAAHGSQVPGDDQAAVFAQAARVRQFGVFAEVLVGFWKAKPSLIEAVNEARTPRVFIVPLFLSAGYFSEQVLPKALGFSDGGTRPFSRVQHRVGRTFFYCEPIGTHPAMVELIVRLATATLAERAPDVSPSQAALCVVGHGTPAHAHSRRAVEGHVKRIRESRVFREAHALFIDEPPKISEWRRQVTSHTVVVVPFLMTPGKHTQRDIPIALGADPSEVAQRIARGESPWVNPQQMAAYRVLYSTCVGTEPALSEIILRRVREMNSLTEATDAG